MTLRTDDTKGPGGVRAQQVLGDCNSWGAEDRGFTTLDLASSSVKVGAPVANTASQSGQGSCVCVYPPSGLGLGPHWRGRGKGLGPPLR